VPRKFPGSNGLAVALLLLTALAAGAQGPAEAPGIDLQATPILGRTCEAGWLTVRVRLTNTSDEDVRGRVSATFLASGTEALSEAFSDEVLARHSKRDVFYYLFVPNVYVLAGEVHVRFEAAGDPAKSREVVLKGNAIRVDHLEQPVWAWK